MIIPDIESVNYGRGVGYEINEFQPPVDSGAMFIKAPTSEFFTNNLSPHFQAKRPEDLQVMRGSNLSQNIESSPTAVFTTNLQFHDVQSNTVDHSDQKSCVKSMANQHCAQGLSLNSPNGA